LFKRKVGFFIYILTQANFDMLAPLEKIPYVDYPELRISKNESSEMPFRYVKGTNGEPIMPEVC
jgi:ribosome biogenesis SPOUT family RNA methylase Rps3